MAKCGTCRHFIGAGDWCLYGEYMLFATELDYYEYMTDD